jgi:hypothetical protein
MNILAYIDRLHITDEYILIFLSIEKYKELYSSALRYSVVSLINRGIYPIFLVSTAIFVGYN